MFPISEISNSLLQKAQSRQDSSTFQVTLLTEKTWGFPQSEKALNIHLPRLAAIVELKVKSELWSVI